MNGGKRAWKGDDFHENHFFVRMRRMNAGRLMNLLDDIVKDEEDKKFNTKLQELKDLLSSNQIDKIEEKRTEIVKEAEDGFSFGMPKTNRKILKEIGALRFSSEGIIVELTEIFLNSGYKTLNRLEEYQKERKAFFSTAKRTIEDLENLKIERHFSFEDYEVAFVLPKSFSNIDDLPRALHTFDEFLKNISEIVGESVENKISIIDDGCWEFFVIKGIGVAKIVDLVLNKFVDFYKKVQDLQEGREKIKFLRNKVVEEELKIERQKMANNLLEEVVKEITKDLKKKGGREKELPGLLKVNLKKILVLMERGAMLEVVMPYLLDTDNGEESKENQQDNSKAISKAQAKAIEELKGVLIATNQKLRVLEIPENTQLLQEAWPEEKTEEETENAAGEDEDTEVGD